MQTIAVTMSQPSQRLEAHNHDESAENDTNSNGSSSARGGRLRNLRRLAGGSRGRRASRGARSGLGHEDTTRKTSATSHSADGGEYKPVNNVHDAVGDEDISQHDLGIVDVNVAVADRDVDGLAGEGLDGRVGEGRAVGDCAGDDVVLQDGGEVFLRDVVEGAEGGEGVVVGGEDCDVLGGEEGVDEVGGGGGAREGGQVGGGGGVDDVLGDGEDGVDDVDDAAGELDVLVFVSMSARGKLRLLVWGDDLQPG